MYNSEYSSVDVVHRMGLGEGLLGGVVIIAVSCVSKRLSEV